MNINFVDLSRQYQAYKTDIDKHMNEVISSTSFIMGPKVTELEDKLAHYTGVKQAISCSSGTDALLLALMAHEIKPGDEIITSPFTFIATAEVIALVGAKPVFIDITEETFNLNPKSIETAISDKTKGIIAVDLFGHCADYKTITTIAEKHQLFVIADASQSFGATQNEKKSCSLAETSCTSFFPAKPFGCYGDGGMIFTNNDETAEKYRSIRAHGKGSAKYDHVRIGLNARLDTLQAAVLLGKLKHFNKEIDMRNSLATRYNNELTQKIKKPQVLANNISAWAQYCIRTKDRDLLQNFLKEKGIPTAIYYPKPLHIQKAFAYLGYNASAFPISEKVSKDILGLPIHPFLKDDEQAFVIETLNSFYK